MNSLVSIIVPCYNQAKFLEEALDSIISQTYKHWECIVINDGSTDNTKIIAEKYLNQDKRFHYIEQSNQGLSAARNAGIKEAQGEFIQLLDSDDLIGKDKLLLQTESFHTNPDADITYCEYLCFDNDNKNNFYTYSDNFIISENPLSDFIFHWGKKLIIPPHCFLFTKKCFDKWGYFDKNLKIAEDWDLYVRFSINNPKFVFVEGKLALYRRHPESICAEANRERLYRYKIKMYKKHLNNSLLSKEYRKYIRFSLHDFIGKEAFEYLRKRKVYFGVKKLISAAWFSRKPFYYFYHGLYWFKKGI